MSLFHRSLLLLGDTFSYYIFFIKVFHSPCYFFLNFKLLYVPLTLISFLFFHALSGTKLSSLFNNLPLCPSSVPSQSSILPRSLFRGTKGPWRCPGNRVHRVEHFALKTKPVFLCDFDFLPLNLFLVYLI